MIISFQDFGEIEYVRILRDRVTKESKGLAYVKYFRAYHAALAYEGCNQSKRQYINFFYHLDAY